MAKFYYTLAVLEDGSWSPQFGDYDKQTVKDEMEEYKPQYGKKNMKIVCSLAGQKYINAAIRKLNETAR